MKNIHVLTTDKPSRLFNCFGKLDIGEYITTREGLQVTNQHIYITSTEEIKEGDWCLFDRFPNKIHKAISNMSSSGSAKKIILTTDQDLDGVQPIDDEFLEWFVKNPSCEYVEVSEDYFKPSNMVYGHDTEPYKIIIPKEEPKLSNICIKCGVDLYSTEGKFICQKHPKECKGIYLSKETLLIHAAQKKQEQETLEEKLAKIVSKEPSKFWAESDERSRIREEQKQHIIDMMKSDEELGLYEEPKQETLEEAAERLYPNGCDGTDRSAEIYRRIFIEGAKWQQKKICDSEVIQRIRASKSDAEARRIIRTI